MALIESEGIFGMDQGCDLHGDDRMRECSMCGIEFCALCFPNSVMCPGCASETVEDELEDGADFEDAQNVDELLDYDDMVPPASETRSRPDNPEG
jgi:hypothetical protein